MPDPRKAVIIGIAGDHGSPLCDEAMVRVVAVRYPGDFVIVTGRLGLRWQERVIEDSSILVSRRPTLLGNATKLCHATGWSASVGPAAMVDHRMRARGVNL